MKMLFVVLFTVSALAAEQSNYSIALSDGVSVTYSLEGEAGTKDSTQVWRCRILDQKTKQLLAKDLLCRTLTIKPDGSQDLTEAQFQIKDQVISYEFEELKKSYSLRR